MSTGLSAPARSLSVWSRARGRSERTRRGESPLLRRPSSSGHYPKRSPIWATLLAYRRPCHPLSPLGSRFPHSSFHIIQSRRMVKQGKPYVHFGDAKVETPSPAWANSEASIRTTASCPTCVIRFRHPTLLPPLMTAGRIVPAAEVCTYHPSPPSGTSAMARDRRKNRRS